MRILIVDDDPKLRSYVCAGLQQAGIEGVPAPDGESALRVLQEDTRGFDLILLDVMMPALSGWELLHDLRERGRETPVIFVTARDSVEERVRGLRLGADDYVIKPFAFQELLARIEVVLRRRKQLPPIAVADLRLDLARRNARRGEHSIDLSPREFDLLLALARAEGEVLSRAELLRQVWGIESEPSTNLVDVHIGRLRRKLDAHGPPLIQTVRGEGYRLAATP
jgi:two-component system copper resistance phosphate regulon response regulator CusR